MKEVFKQKQSDKLISHQIYLFEEQKIFDRGNFSKCFLQSLSMKNFGPKKLYDLTI